MMQYILVSVMVDRLALQLGLTLGNDSSFLNAACEYVIRVCFDFTEQSDPSYMFGSSSARVL
jgi:hypothetical protein